MKPQGLDLFCGGGGCSKGYADAGFEMTGVDIAPQPHYPYRFVQADWAEYLAEHWQEYDFIHASPPCQGYSRMRHLPWLQGRNYPRLIGEVRSSLEATQKIWVIENVSDAPLNGAELCGKALGLPIIRHRRFESSILLLFPSCPGHQVLFAGNANMHKRGRNGGIMGLAEGVEPADALGIDWMTKREMRQAVPPAYTRFIGAQVMQALGLAS